MKKKAEDLKPGDVFKIASQRLMYLKAYGPDLGNDGVNCVDLDARPQSFSMRYLSGDYECEVESPALSPAQQHAEELVAELRQAHKDAHDGFGLRLTQIEALLARIDPPKPPSAEEALQVLDDLREAICTGDSTVARNKADAVLKRARAAGMLKGGA